MPRFPNSFLRSGENTHGDSFSRSETRRSGFDLRQAALLATRAIPLQTSTSAPLGITGSTKATSAAIASITAFPASQIDQIGANNFAKGLVEWDLTPLHFRDLGTTKLYSNWARLALFAGGLAANPASSDRSGYADAGAQVDFRLVLVLPGEVDLISRLRSGARSVRSHRNRAHVLAENLLNTSRASACGRPQRGIAIEHAKNQGIDLWRYASPQ